MRAFLRLMALAMFSVSLALAASNQAASGVIQKMDRTVLHGNIVHYRYEVKVGPGEFDAIRLHRIVKEPQPLWPERTKDAVLLLPGQPTYFEGLYVQPLISQVPDRDRSIAVYLAKNGIDVWGMDYGWALVPAGRTDFAFMKNWGIEKDVQHARMALEVARSMRGGVLQGADPFYVLGLSYGGMIAYGAAAEDALQPKSQRNVKGVIPIDIGVKYGDASIRTDWCAGVAWAQSQITAGIYNDDTGLVLTQFGELALSDPAGASPLIPGLTNYQAALASGAWGAGGDPRSWHFVGGYLDANGVPYDLRFTEPRLWLDMEKVVAPPHFPMQLNYDIPAMDIDPTSCPDVVVPYFADHLHNITVPILYVGAAGGIGVSGYYTTTVTASQDVTKFTVQLLSDAQRMMDFGHADTVAARDADKLVWKPILKWIMDHR
jgi:hypothetical protein